MTPEELTLAEIRQHIGGMPEDSRIRVQCIASTFRNCLQIDPEHAGLALALVGAEQAAKP